jgi:hypothetical protein
MKVAVAAAVALLAIGGWHASAGAQRSPIVDRTFLCTPNAFGGVRDLDISASPPGKTVFGDTISAILHVGSGSWSQRLVFVVARNGRVENERAGVYAHAARCRAASRPIALSARGLPGPPTRWRTDANCPVRGRILVRVRATLQSPASWGRAGKYNGVRRNVVAATVAVRDERTGRPIALMRMDATGDTEFWSAASCG